jgi:trehalose-phosphatase
VREHVNEIEDILAAVPREVDSQLLLVVGFDGVVADYEGDPADVRLSPETCTTLDALATRPGIAVAIITGRRLVDVKQRAGIDAPVFYIGLHGLEVEGPNFTTTARDVVEQCRDRIRDIAARLECTLSSVSGVRVEDKDAIIAVHTREAGPGDAVWARMHLLSTAAAVAREDELRAVRGNHVLELVPNTMSPRATAIRVIARHLEERHCTPVRIVYIGEDVIDDDAYEALAGDAITVAVGARAPKARYHVTCPAAVRRLIEALAGRPEAPAAIG